jgi:hypothetical protein
VISAIGGASHRVDRLRKGFPLAVGLIAAQDRYVTRGETSASCGILRLIS